jgi:hypothetical protein
LLIYHSNDGCSQGRVGARAFQAIHLLILAGLIVAIVAGVDTVSDNVNTQDTARTIRKAASLILLAVGLLITAIILKLVASLRSVLPADRILLFCAAASMPFIFIRLILFVLEAFVKSALFNPIQLNIYIQAFMQVLMEWIAIGLYILSGLLSPVMDKSLYAGETSELLPTTSNYSSRNQYPQQYPEQHSRGTDRYNSPRK